MYPVNRYLQDEDSDLVIQGLELQIVVLTTQIEGFVEDIARGRGPSFVVPHLELLSGRLDVLTRLVFILKNGVRRTLGESVAPKRILMHSFKKQDDSDKSSFKELVLSDYYFSDKEYHIFENDVLHAHEVSRQESLTVVPGTTPVVSYVIEWDKVR